MPSPTPANGARTYVPAARGPSGNSESTLLPDGEVVGDGAAVVVVVATGVGLGPVPPTLGGGAPLWIACSVEQPAITNIATMATESE